MRSVFAIGLSLGLGPFGLISGCHEETVEEPAPVCVLVREVPERDRDPDVDEDTQEDIDEDMDEAVEEGTATIVQRAMTTDEWVRLMSGNQSYGARVTTDCAGRPIRWPAGQFCGGDDDGQATPVALTEESVIESRGADSTERLVWLVTHRYPNGDGLGPVALVELEDNRAKIRAMGSLRARVGRARLKLRGLGDRTILVAEGETCEHENDPTTCRRAARLMPRLGSRFIPSGLRYETGRCAGPAWIKMTDMERVELDNGWFRDFTLHTSFDLLGGVLVVRETIIARDFDPTESAYPPSLTREVSNNRTISMWGSRLLLDDESHWERLLDNHGSTHAPRPGDNDDGDGDDDGG